MMMPLLRIALILLCFLGATERGYSEAKNVDPKTLWAHLPPHPDFPIEWWYMTGFLTSDAGRHFGFQATFFRTTRSTKSDSKKTTWSPGQIFGFHGGVSDLDKRRFFSTERERRGFSESVVANKDPFSVRIGRNRLAHSQEDPASLALTFRVGLQSYSLTLTPQSPPIWHDKDKKFYTGPNADDWAYYYSYPLVRLTGTRTTILPDGRLKTEKVHGQCWFDHEWMKNAMNKNQIGWIWIWGWNRSFTKGIMLYQMLDQGVRISSFHRATLIQRTDDNWTVRRTNEVELIKGKKGLCLSPGHLRFLVDKKILVKVHPMIDKQILTGAVIYWEGASRIDLGKRSLLEKGEGYLEVTGLSSLKKRSLCGILGGG